jgi:hypothetical protein
LDLVRTVDGERTDIERLGPARVDDGATLVI